MCVLPVPFFFVTVALINKYFSRWSFTGATILQNVNIYWVMLCVTLRTISSRSGLSRSLVCFSNWYELFCCISIGYSAIEFWNPGGTYELITAVSKCSSRKSGRRKNNAGTDKNKENKLAGPLAKKKLSVEGYSKRNGKGKKVRGRR